MAYINGNEVLFSPQVTVVEGGVDIDVDTRMSDTSENPVQNKVVKAYVDEKTAPATDSVYGTVKVCTDADMARINNGIYMRDDGVLSFVPANEAAIDGKTNDTSPITPKNLDYAVKAVGDGYYAFASEVGNIETALDAILAMQETLIGGGA